jgi:hypothetical protein
MAKRRKAQRKKTWAQSERNWKRRTQVPLGQLARMSDGEARAYVRRVADAQP